MNLLNMWREYRQQKKAQKQQKKLLQTWLWLEKVFKSGQLSFDYRARRLYIMQPFAVLLMARGADGWVNSIHAIFQYTYWKQSQEAWGNFIHKEELAAVRKAMGTLTSTVTGTKKKGKAATPSLTRDDIQRIKRSRRKEIALSDMEPPKAQPFEFFIIPDSTEPKVDPLAIGYYDPNTEEMEVATWDEVKNLILK